MTSERRMPERVKLGAYYSTTMAAPMGQRDEWAKSPEEINMFGLRTVMGYCLPTWQRGFVWTDKQSTLFIESAWRGVNLGTFTYNQASYGSPFDNLLIDGQQRMRAIERYLNDEFKVFGYLWSEVTDADKRAWRWNTQFPSYVTTTEDEHYLRDYYDIMNFGGTAHKESERARTS